MKKLTTLAIIIAISTFCVAQKSITEITGGEILWGWIEDSYIAFPDYDGTINYTYDQVNAILQGDVVRAKGLQSKYKTSLQQEAFAQSPEATKLKRELEEEKKYIKSSLCSIEYQCEDLKYDAKLKAFVWNKMYSDIRFYQETGYFCAGKFMISYPQQLFTIQGEDYGNRGYYYRQIFRLPTLPIETALKIEENIKDVRLLFVGKFIRSKVVDDDKIWKREYLYFKATKVYLINRMGDMEIYADLTTKLFPPKK